MKKVENRQHFTLYTYALISLIVTDIFVIIFVDMTKNLKIRTKFKEFEDKIYYFGINLSEEEYKEIMNKILEYNGALNILQVE